MSISDNRRESLRLPLPCPLRSALLTLLAVAVIGGVALSAAAAVRIEFPSESDPGLPYYARVDPIGSRAIVPQTDEWAAIVFYRSPACVPAGFNLFDFFDVPGAFFCPLTVDGFFIWRNGPPPIDSAPMKVQSSGLGAVPVWFVSWEDLQVAVADNVLTVPELMAIPSLRMGSASFFHEELHPSGGGAQQPFMKMRAHGVMVDGQHFTLDHLRNRAGVQTAIEFFDR